MTKRTVIWTVGITAVAAVAIGVGIECYVRSCSKAGGGEPRPYANYTQTLGLKGTQAATVRSLEAAYARDLAAVRAGMAKDRVDLCAMLALEVWDQKAVDRVAARLAAAQSRQQRVVVTYLGKIREVLSPEQRARFANLMIEDLCTACRGEGMAQACICPSGSGHQCGHKG